MSVRDSTHFSSTIPGLFARGPSVLLVGALSACASPLEAVAVDSPPAEQRAEPIRTVTRPLAVLAGRFSTPSTKQPRVRFSGTDLGWTFRHGDELWMLFGDSWASSLGFPLSIEADDALGKISLRDFPDGDAVERWITAHPAQDPRMPWRAAAPPVDLVTTPDGRVAPLRQMQNGRVLLTSGEWLTPMAGFSNARRDESSAAFGIFFRNDPVQCNEQGACSDGFDCDAQLGRCAPVTDASAACVVGGSACQCVAVGKGQGLCVDKGSSVYDPSTERGRAASVVVNHQVGNALRDNHTTFATRPWGTHRYFNLAVRAVDDFDPARPYGAGNDYATANGDDPGREGLFIWGRPNFVGMSAKRRDAQLYLAWVPMPSFGRTGSFRWEPRHFAGLDAAGMPRFSTRESDAVPLDLDADREGVQPEEMHDFVGQMTITWLPSIGRFAMIYGGDAPPSFLTLAFGADAALVNRDPVGALHIRFAPHPWGPWTPPRPLYAAGDVQTGTSGQYGPGGILHHPNCKHPTCAPSEPVLLWLAGEPGRLYGVNIIEPWTMERPDRSIDLYWNLSTWNPYQVVLMKTRLSSADLPSR